MFRFEHPEYLWGLALLPLLFLAVLGHRRLRASDWNAWGTQGSNARIASFRAARSGPGVFAGVMCLFMLALANPQWGTRTTTIESRTADVYLLFDISNSMLAEDVAPSRLERARQLAIRLADALKTERLGLIYFAGNAYVQSPLTTDWEAIRLFLQAADPSQAGTQGTAIGEAVRLAIRDGQTDEGSGGLLILLTDGEDHDEGALDAVSEAAASGWATHVVGIGSESGGHIPVLNAQGRDVRRDAQGEPVRTRLSPALLRQLAEAGGGSYHDLREESDIAGKLKAELAGYGQRKAGTRVFAEHRSLYGWLLFPGILALLALVIRQPFKDSL